MLPYTIPLYGTDRLCDPVPTCPIEPLVQRLLRERRRVVRPLPPINHHIRQLALTRNQCLDPFINRLESRPTRQLERGGRLQYRHVHLLLLPLTMQPCNPLLELGPGEGQIGNDHQTSP